MNDATKLLSNVTKGDTTSLNQFHDLVYAESRALTAYKFVAERPGHTSQATALVNDADLRLSGVGGMGKVFREPDTKLNRENPIKVPPESNRHEVESYSATNHLQEELTLLLLRQPRPRGATL